MTDLIERARTEMDLRKRMHGDDRSNWSRADRMMEELLTALEAAREDAERYRWLRSRVGWMRPGDEAPWTTPSGIYLVATMVSAVYGNCDEQTDAAIDQARGKGVVPEQGEE